MFWKRFSQLFRFTSYSSNYFNQSNRNSYKHFHKSSQTRQFRIMSAGTGVVVASKAGLPVPEDAKEKKHHLPNGRFANPWTSWLDQNRFEIGMTVMKGAVFGGWPKPKGDEVKVIKPQFEESRTEVKELRATWLGHACFLVEFPGGFRALFDPVFCHRCSPFQWMGPARFTKVPCEIEDIPFVDAVFISHAHYDHLDLPSVKRIHAKWPKAHFFVPLGNKSWFASIGIQDCTEQDWWEDTEITIDLKDEGSGETTGNLHATLSNLPCQHTAGRTATDLNSTLWSSWVVESGGKKVFHAGDTGYRAVPKVPDGEDDYGEKYKDLPICPAFKQIGDLRGPFDFGMIPIGAYAPRWCFSAMHSNPVDAVNIFLDTKCKKAIGMHWGTWVLTMEPVLEPPQLLKKALTDKGISDVGVFDVTEIGGSRVFPEEDA